MQLSIRKLTFILVSLVILVTVATSAAGIYVLQQHYRTAEDRLDSDARGRLHNAVLAMRSQVEFYQGIVDLIASKPELSDLVEFGSVDSLTKWSQTVARMLPGTLGTALASLDGKIHGDLHQQRIGDACQADLQSFSRGTPLAYPPIHTDRPGLEHFDLFAVVRDTEGALGGRLFISFRLEVVENIMQNLVGRDQLLELRDDAGKSVLIAGGTGDHDTLRSYAEQIPGTDWQLVLTRPDRGNLAFYRQLILTDLGILLVVAIVLAFLTRHLLQRFNLDLVGIHQALLDVYNGRFRHFSGWSGIRETEMLMPDLENIARRLQEQQQELREQSLTDPMTGLYNRRYFDILLEHELEQSRRSSSSMLAIIDLDRFKMVNDQLGHMEGDRALIEVSDFLRKHCRSTDTLARLGGDEFAIILIEMHEQALESWLEKLLQDFDRFMANNPLTAELEDQCTFSVGISHIDLALYANTEQLFCAADDAMYNAKLKRSEHSRYLIASSTRPGRTDAAGQEATGAAGGDRPAE